MRKNCYFEIGQEVYHPSMKNLIMTIDEINEEESQCHCTWINPKTYEKIDGDFPYSSLRDYSEKSYSEIYIG